MSNVRHDWEEPQFSSWARAANVILFHVAYLDESRGFKSICDYPPHEKIVGRTIHITLPKPLNPEKLRRIMAVKADYVRMAEEAEQRGETWQTEDFNRMCREGFQSLL